MTGFPRLLNLGLLLALSAPQAVRAQTVGHARLVALGDLNHTSLPVPTAVSGGAATSFNTAYFAGNDSEHGTEVWRWSGSGAATLFADVRPGPESGNPAQFTAMGSLVIWVANDGVRGPEIRGSQTLSPSSPLMDLQPGAAHAAPQILGASGGVVWFTTASWQDGYPITSLWSMATFGDPVKVGVYARDSIQQVSMVPGQPHLFFIARVHGTDPRHRLYRVDGIKTAQLIESLDPATTGAVPPAGSYAATPGYVCYRQVSGSYLLRMLDFTGGGFSTFTQQSDGTTLPWFVSNGVDRVCFAARSGATGVELWTTMGTPASTTLLADVVPGTASSNPSRLMMSAGNPGVFFQVDEGAGRDLYFIDAKELPAPVARKLRSAVQTSTEFAIVDADEIVLNVPDNNIVSLWLADGRTGTGQWLGPVFSSLTRIWNPSQQMPLGRQLNVVATTSSTGEELYRLEGTATLNLLSLNSGSASASPRQFFPWNSEQLCVADTSNGKGKFFRVGASTGPSIIPQATPLDVQGNSASSHPADFTECGNVLLFTAHDGTSRRLYMSADGQPGSAMVVDGIHNPEQLVLFQGKVFMLGAPAANSTGTKKLYQAEVVGSMVTVDAFDEGRHAATAVIAAEGRLFFVEPMGGGTEWLRTVLPDFSLGDSAIFYQDAAGTGITQLTAGSGRLFFSALSHPGAKRVIWATDGTLTSMRTPEFVLERPQLLGALGGACVFWREPATGVSYDLFLWDGESTSLLYQGGGQLTDTPEQHRVAGKPAGVEFAGRFYFADQSGSLLCTDGTGVVTRFNDPTLLIRPEALAVINGRLVFLATGRNNESVLFALTEPAGPQVVRMFSARSLPSAFVKVGSRLHFTLAHLEANLGETELWQTDGTLEGTALDLHEVQMRENVGFQMGAFRGHLVLGTSSPAASTGVDPMLLNYAPFVPQPLTLTGALRGKPFSFTYADIVTGAVVDIEGDTVSPLRLAVSTGTLTRNGSAVTDSTEIAPGDSFVWTPEATDSGLLFPFEVQALDAWHQGEAGVSVRVDSPLDVWAQGHFTEEELADPAIAGAEADADGDGVSNALEFVFGRHPRAHTSEPPCTPSAGETQGGAKVVRFTFVRTAVLAEGTVLTVQSSPDLTPDSWVPVATKSAADPWSGTGTVSETTLPDGRVQVTVEMAEPAGGQAFMRLGVGL